MGYREVRRHHLLTYETWSLGVFNASNFRPVTVDVTCASPNGAVMIGAETHR